MLQDDVSIRICQRDWSLLRAWLRWLGPLRAFDGRPGALALYNLVTGVSVRAFLPWSRTKFHLVAMMRAMETKWQNINAGHLTRLPGTARTVDKTAPLRGCNVLSSCCQAGEP
ncbi:hypothetical protein F4861DRAFT_224641 [Xylaria intraflava]|nr:hypothetical protein F4861DRAFT_224641 [Xylaria intraflava]